MKTRFAIIAATMTLLPPAAFAQNAPVSALPPPAVVPQATPSAQAGYFPPLPPSRKCAAADIAGEWRILHVYENPIAQAATEFSAQPYQYIYFNPNGLYQEYKSSYAPDSIQAVNDKLHNQPPTPLQQYLMHESGFMYFYKDGVALDTQACFIVANPTGQFQAGQMLLMPPEGQSLTRMVKVYQRMGARAAAAQPAAPDAAANPRTRNPNGRQFRGRGRIPAADQPAPDSTQPPADAPAQ